MALGCGSLAADGIAARDRRIRSLGRSGIEATDAVSAAGLSRVFSTTDVDVHPAVSTSPRCTWPRAWNFVQSPSWRVTTRSCHYRLVIEAVGDDGDLQEVYDTERQLLYVACTRARDRLSVSGIEPASEFLDDFGSS